MDKTKKARPKGALAVTVQEIAEDFGREPCTVYRWIKSGRVPVEPIASPAKGRLEFSRAKISAWYREIGLTPNRGEAS